MAKLNKNKLGFSLVQLLIVIIIIAIFAAILIPSLLTFSKQASANDLRKAETNCRNAYSSVSLAASQLADQGQPISWNNAEKDTLGTLCGETYSLLGSTYEIDNLTVFISNGTILYIIYDDGKCKSTFEVGANRCTTTMKK